MTTKKNSLLRQRRVRDRLKKASKGRYRLSIFRSSKNIYAQIIDLAEKAKEKGIKKVIFDRGRYVYHGRVKAFADGARKAGLDF